MLVACMMIICAIYFKIQYTEGGHGLRQHDVEQWKGMSNEITQFKDQTGEETLWTNSMFGGMPTVQISIGFTGNILKTGFQYFYDVFRQPMGLVLMHMLGFYLMAIFLRIHPLIGFLGAIAFSFASYEIIILQAGHITKSAATALMAPVVGAFIYSYRQRNLLGIALCGILMALEISMNHLQVTYYLFYLLGALGVYFLIDAWRKHAIKEYLMTTGGLLVVIGAAVLINLGNIQMTNDYAKYTIRGKNDVTIQPNGEPVTVASEGLDKDYITQWSYGIGETFTLISPNVKGGGSFEFKNSQFEETLENADIPSSAVRQLQKGYGVYWGDQPFTSGPVYIGIVVFFLALLGLIFLDNKIKWPLFIITVLAIMLSWGKNFMWLTEFFIDYIPGYDKFRTVTIFLVMVELCVPLLGMLFLDHLLKNREEWKTRKKGILIASASFLVFMIVVNAVGLGDNYTSAQDKEQIEGSRKYVYEQIMAMNPNDLRQQNIDPNNEEQIAQIVDAQVESITASFDKLKVVREDIYHASWMRSILFGLFASAFVLLFLYTSLSGYILVGGLILLTMIDQIPVARDYLGEQEVATNVYKYWEDVGRSEFPIMAGEGDEQIMLSELAINPALASKVDAAAKKAVKIADEKGLTGIAKQNAIDSYRFMALNFETNYRVYDMTSGGRAFQSSRTSYFHKSIGGYHGAKLRNFANLIDFQLATNNNKVLDILNVKYILQADRNGAQMATINDSALGNAWLVKRVETYETPNDEIRALGTRFKLKNVGQGTLFMNGKPVSEAVVYGREKLQYLIPGSPDSLRVPLSNGMREGMEAIFVVDVNGKTDLVMPQLFESDTAKASFLKMVSITVENTFLPREEAVMLKSESTKLKQQEFSGSGTVKMTAYAPNRISYQADLNGNQLVVFSEIYYPHGWKAFVDGKETEILKVDYLLRGVEMEGGTHKVDLVFDVPEYHRSNTISLIVSFLLIAFLLFALWRKYRPANESVES